ncbi:hypothetical protein BS17DRAFT_769774 [Gyrodon lividus]|nr:hypothetical protein BS17DRAFT_769774 [Gyrodon lividus]
MSHNLPIDIVSSWTAQLDPGVLSALPPRLFYTTNLWAADDQIVSAHELTLARMNTRIVDGEARVAPVVPSFSRTGFVRLVKLFIHTSPIDNGSSPMNSPQKSMRQQHYPHPSSAEGIPSFSFLPSHRSTQGPASSYEETLFATERDLSLQYGESASEALLHTDSRDRPHEDENHTSSKGSSVLQYWCYALHAFLAVIHVILVAMLFGHPEHRVTVPTDSSILTVGLSAFLQAFYTVYTAILVLITQRLAVSGALARRQKLTAIHDMRGAWSGIGAAINSLWQQTKVAASPSTILVILTYLGCISGLHIISSSVVQFQVFNNTVTSTIQSTLAWPAPSVNISNLEWISITPLAPMLPTLSELSLKGLTNNTLYDIPSVDYPFTEAIVNGTTVTAECGLLSNISAATSVNSAGFLNVTVSGLGQISLTPGVTTALELGNLANNDIVHSDADALFTTADGKQVFVPATSYFVACSLNTTTTAYHLDLTSGQLVIPTPDANDPLPWTVWSPAQSTELTAALNSALANVLQTDFCEQMQLSGSVDSECGAISIVDVYMMSLLGIDMTTGPAVGTTVDSLITLERQQMENAVSRVAAELVWLSGEVGTSGGGFQRIEGDSFATQQVLGLRLNVNTTPHEESHSFPKVVVGLCASTILLVLAFCMLRDPSKPHLSTVTNAGVSELMWISAHSLSLRNHIKGIEDSSLDRLREECMVDVCLTEVHSTTIVENVMASRHLQDGISTSPEVAAKLEESAVQGHQNVSSSFIGRFPLYWWSYMLHGILVALHVALLALLIRHPEHRVVIPLDNGVMITGLSVILQAFYTLYTAGLVFVTQRLALSGFIARRQYLTAVHDVSGAWAGIGAAINVVWQQRKVASSISMTIAVMIYLACVSVLHIASSTIMQFTAFNSTITSSVQSTMAWPSQSFDLAGVSWIEAVPAVPSTNLLSGLSTYGLSNNTLYDTLITADPFFVNATVNATSLQANCGLLSNLSYGLTYTVNSNVPDYNVNFSVNGLGSGTFLLGQESPNEVFFVGGWPPLLASGLDTCPLCDQYLFFMLTTGIDVDGSIDSTVAVEVNYTSSGSPSPLTTYFAACSVDAQTVTAILDVQDVRLNPSPSQAQIEQKPWTLWSPGGSANLTSANTREMIEQISTAFQVSSFSGCRQHEYFMCINITTIAGPYQLEQAITQVAAEIMWLAGQAGESRGGFQRTSGESQVTQLVTQWRLNVNTIPVLFASTASVVLFVVGFFLVGRPPRRSTSVSGVSVLETLWIAAHSQALYERMVDIDDPSLDNLRTAGMFGICIADVNAEGTTPNHRIPGSDSDTLLG